MRMPKGLRSWLRKDLPRLAVMIALLCSFRSAIADWNIVPSGSMNPTILVGDRIFVNKLAYGLRVPFTMWHVADWSSPQRGDVIVFQSPADGERLVKRVVALPGETVKMVNNQIFINGVAATYAVCGMKPGTIDANETMASAGPHPILLTPSLSSRRNFGPIAVPANEYFVLGDNRDNSADSRYIGCVPRMNITGRSSRVLFSLDADAWYLPRFRRTLETLP